ERHAAVGIRSPVDIEPQQPVPSDPALAAHRLVAEGDDGRLEQFDKTLFLRGGSHSLRLTRPRPTKKGPCGPIFVVDSSSLGPHRGTAKTKSPKRGPHFTCRVSLRIHGPDRSVRLPIADNP